MSRIGIFMADGCEMVEALTVVDCCRRAGIDIDTISINQSEAVTSSHKVTFLCDTTAEKEDYSALEGIVVPGGVPGVDHLLADETVDTVLRSFAAEGKLVAAICAGPTVPGRKGLLDGVRATCHPGWEEKMGEALLSEDTVVRDRNFITSRGMGTSIPFAFEIVRYYKDEETIRNIAKGMVYPV